MARNNKNITKRQLDFLCKIICITILLLIPVNITADQAVTTDAQTAQMNNLEYWPPVIAQLEALYAQKPQDQNVIMSLANAYNNYGVLLARNQRWAEAASYIEQAIRVRPEQLEMRNNLSNVYYEQGKELYLNQKNINTYSAQNAKQFANKAISLNPKNVNAYLLLGDIEYMSQNMLDAERAWQKAAQLLPDNQEVQKRLAQIQRETLAETDMQTVFNPHFNIKIDASLAANPNFDVNYILDNAYNSVTPDFQFFPHEKVPVVVYNRQEYEDTVVDAPSWSEAAYDGKIRLAIKPDQKDFHQLQSDVIHEFTHVIISKLSDNKCPRWFNEGIAKYEEYLHGVKPRIYMLGIAYNTDQIVPWDNIDTALISQKPQEALLAYQQAFSFIYYLVQIYGMPNIVQVLKLVGTNGDFPAAIKQVYGMSLENLQKNWRVWLTEFITDWANKPATMGVDYQ